MSKPTGGLLIYQIQVCLTVFIISQIECILNTIHTFPYTLFPTFNPTGGKMIHTKVHTYVEKMTAGGKYQRSQVRLFCWENFRKTGCFQTRRLLKVSVEKSL